MDPRFSQIPTLRVFNAIQDPSNIGNQLVMEGVITGVPPTIYADVFGISCILQRDDSAIVYTNTGSTASPTWTALGGGGGGGMAIGDEVVDSDKNRILFTDGDNKLIDDANFTRQVDGQTLFSSTFGSDVVSYAMDSNLFGLGVTGIGTKTENAAGDIGYNVSLTSGGLQDTSVLYFADTSNTRAVLSKNLYEVEVKGVTSEYAKLSIRDASVDLITRVGSNGYGFQKKNDKVLFGHVLGSGATYVEVDFVTNLIKMTNVPTYADDAAAITGGLTTGMLYKTTTGGITALNIVP